MLLTHDPIRLAGAAAASAGWLALCLGLWGARVRRRLDGLAALAESDWLVAYASQTGGAELLARRTAELLSTGGLAARAACISSLDDATLRQTTRILFVAATYGEGDPPDTAARFAARLGADTFDNGHLHYAVLALGDRNYAHYCGFGRALDEGLAARGAVRLFERVEVDRGDAAALADWQRHVGRLAGTDDLDPDADAGAADWHGPAYGDWRIVERVLLNPGSAGAPLYRLALAPADGILPDWEAGDLAQVSAPADPDHPREYSIASLPADGRLELLVRLQRRADGSPGAASGWLCGEAAVVDGMDVATGAAANDTVRLRLRAHARFRLGDNARRPLIAIGNGSGLAGLRSLLKARMHLGERDNWLLFGERSAAHDFLLRDELEAWRDAGRLRLGLAFSRDQAERRYVQHLLREQAHALRDWIGRGAAIYVCGSLQGMAGGVHEALADILGAAQLEALADAGRYRRDVY